MGRIIRSRNAEFQQVEALLHNRKKRSRSGRFVVQGVRPITLAVESGLAVDLLIYNADAELSRWADELVRAAAHPVGMPAELIEELAEKPGTPVELVAVGRVPADDLDRIVIGDDFLGVVLDRPTQPGNVGTTIRSADALGAHGVVVTGHAADPYDPRTVRASTGSLFSVPVVRAASHGPVLDRVERARAAGVAMRTVAADEDGDVDVWDADLTGPTLLLVGNETVGLSSAWREAADVTVRIPMTGSATSLNASNAATLLLYEASRQRSAAR